MRRASLVAGSQQLPDVQVVLRQRRVRGVVSVRNVRRRRRLPVLPVRLALQRRLHRFCMYPSLVLTLLRKCVSLPLPVYIKCRKLPYSSFFRDEL